MSDVFEAFRLDGRVAIVTGASSGLGARFARVLAGAGASVVVAARRAERVEALAEELDGLALPCDVVDAGNRDRLLAATLDRFGRVDILVNNAGVGTPEAAESETHERFAEVLDVNLTAAFLLAKAAERALRQTSGAFVSIASTRAEMSEPDTEAYSASKGGLVALTHALAMSLAPVRVNCISPGWIATRDYNKLRRKDHAQHPVGRVGRPEDIAEIVAWLLDGERSGFVTGANFTVDGGMTRKMIYVE